MNCQLGNPSCRESHGVYCNMWGPRASYEDHHQVIELPHRDQGVGCLGRVLLRQLAAGAGDSVGVVAADDMRAAST